MARTRIRTRTRLTSSVPPLEQCFNSYMDVASLLDDFTVALGNSELLVSH